jgi:Na+/melibiose symporter-like transporter
MFMGGEIMDNHCWKPLTRYYISMSVSLVLYAVALVVSLLCLKAGVEGPWKYVVATLPVWPALGIPWAVVRFCREMDELQLRVQLEGLAFAFAASAIATFTYGFLQNAGLPEVSWIWVWPVMGSSWIVGVLVARWRYR